MGLDWFGRGAAAAAMTTILVGCGVVGWKYQYAGQEHTMTQPNIAYHEKAIKDVRTRFGDPAAQEDPQKLKGACDLLQKYAAEAPDPGSFTPARDLLDHDAKVACSKAQHLKDQAEAKAEHQRRQDESKREHDAREQQRDADKRAQEKERLTASMTRDSKMVETCDATEGARAARKRHADIQEKAPGATVRKQCTPQRETRTVKAECKDANGFTRPCTKTVAGTDIANYVCPKTIDPEVVQLGLYQLDLLDGYPYPEDRSIRVRDADCEEARARLKSTREKLESATSGKPANTAPPSTASSNERSFE